MAIETIELSTTDAEERRGHRNTSHGVETLKNCRDP